MIHTPREQAERIVKVWRMTDQHDQLLEHYIRQVIRDAHIEMLDYVISLAQSRRPSHLALDGLIDDLETERENIK